MNSFGQIFKVTIFGESHGAGIGVIIDGVPAGIPLKAEDFANDLSRRQSVGAIGTTPRKEPDLPEFLSGIYNDYTCGSPISIFFRNTNTQSKDYKLIQNTPRPGHADFVAFKKYRGFSDPRGGGHFSGRVTLGIVASGVIAKKIINPITISTNIIEIGGEKHYQDIIEKAVTNSDSVGGIIECRASSVPIGLGEPFFGSVESLISHAIFSIPAIKGIEFGSGFESARMHGSDHNDEIINLSGTTKTNHSGGINGGITNSNDIIFRVAVKPTSSIGKPQNTINTETGSSTTIQVNGRHDACIALRIPPVIEAATAIVLADLTLLSNSSSLHTFGK